MKRRGGVVPALLQGALLSSAFAGVVLLTVGTGGAPVSGEPTSASAPAASTSGSLVAALITAHDCWSGPAPDPTVIPGHAVVTLPAGEPAVLPAEVGFEIWLEGRPGTLHAFCP